MGSPADTCRLPSHRADTCQGGAVRAEQCFGFLCFKDGLCCQVGDRRGEAGDWEHAAKIRSTAQLMAAHIRGW